MKKQPPKILDVQFILGAMSSSQYPTPNIPEVAFAGKSNVGKSSLLRVLLNRKKLVRVSKTPGRTREINFFKVITEDKGSFYFTDLPGYGYAKVSTKLQAEWGKLITEYLEKRKNLKLVLLLIDSRRKLSEEELMFMEWMTENEIKYLIVITKIDKMPKTKWGQVEASIKKQMPGKSGIVLFSSLTGVGVNELWSKLEKQVLSD